MKNLIRLLWLTAIISCIGFIIVMEKADNYNDQNRFNKLMSPILVSFKYDGCIKLTDVSGNEEVFINNTELGDALYNIYCVGDTINF